MVIATASTSSQSGADFASVRGVLKIKPFRRLWLVLGLSSFGDWLGLLVTSLFAASQVQGSTAQGAAFGGVIVVSLLPALFFGPLAGVFADRFDRRTTMVVCDLLRFSLFASIPTVALLSDSAALTVTWALVAKFLVEAVGLFWIPAKEASIPNLLPKQRLEAANQLSLITTYGVTPVLAALTVAGLSRGMLTLVDDDASRLWIQPLDVALYANATTFLIAAIVVALTPQLSQRGVGTGRKAERAPSWLRSLIDGGNFVRSTPMVRGLVYGILGAFAAGGTVIGVAKQYAASLSGGNAAFGLMFGTLFVGLGVGMGVGPVLVKGLSRRRWFGISIVFAGASVALLAVVPHLALALPFVLFVGMGAGMAFLAGMTLLGVGVADEIRGRIMGFVQTMVRVVLMLAVAGASFLVGFGGSRLLNLGFTEVQISASRVLLVLAGFLSVLTGVLAFRRMDDKPGVPVLADLWGSMRGRPLTVPGTREIGLFIAIEGGEGAGKSTQAKRLVDWLNDGGYAAQLTREPGATSLGAKTRELLLGATERPTPRAEALLYAADRAQHVEEIIRPALHDGVIVVTDRFAASSMAYQGAGRGLPAAEIGWLSDWASQSLKPDLVILIDLDPAVGLARASERGELDRIESQTLAFHQRVRQEFLDLAAADCARYLVIDGDASADSIWEQIRARVAAMLSSRSGPTPSPVLPATEGAPEPPISAPSDLPEPLTADVRR